jgi:hypothetical protein
MSQRPEIVGALLHADAAVMVVASWEERRAWRDEFRSLGVELVRDRLRIAAWHEEKLQEARRWLWWQEHLVTIIRHRGGPHRAPQIRGLRLQHHGQVVGDPVCSVAAGLQRLEAVAKEPTLDEAKAQFETAWRRWLEWAELPGSRRAPRLQCRPDNRISPKSSFDRN